jgi:hypothetical protein
MRNLALLERRFPAYRLESASLLEALAPISGETVLLVCAEGASHFLARERARELAGEGGPAPLGCAWRPAAASRCAARRGEAEEAPLSLAFNIDVAAGLPALSAFLRASGIVRIELFDPLALPLPLLRALFRLGAPVDLVVGFDETHFPLGYNDVDYCLKLRAKGLRVVMTPHARLLHRESGARGRRGAIPPRNPLSARSLARCAAGRSIL